MRNNSEVPFTANYYETGTPLSSGAELDFDHDRRNRNPNMENVVAFNSRGMGGAALPRYERPPNPTDIKTDHVKGVGGRVVELRTGVQALQSYEYEQKDAA